jgi:putative aldouronate transport system substrate-binding protein
VVFLKKLKVLFSLMALVLLIACSNDKASKADEQVDEKALDNLNASGFPIVKEPLELDVFTGKSLTNVKADWNDLMIWNKYEDMTNMKLKWEQVPGESLEEKRNLTLASGNLPDLFYAARLPVSDLLKYGEQGTFLPLNDLIDKYAPNFKKLMEEQPEIEKAITFPNGDIYSLPNLYDPEFTSLLMNATPWINQKWLDKLDMDMPETTDEYYEFLKAVKENDLNDSGKMDEVPFGSAGVEYIVRWLRGSYGIGNKGREYIDLDPDTKDVRFYVTTDRYKELLQYLNKLYSEELIEKNIFTIEHDQFLTNATEDKYASTVWYSPSELFGKEVGDQFEGALALKGPHGDHLYGDVSHPVTTVGQFAITSENPNPAATMRWIDYFYGDEGAKFFYMGVEGETYEETDDGVKYMDFITDNPDGLNMDQVLAGELAWVGSSPASIIKQEYFQGSESSPQAVAAGEKLKSDFPDEVWSSFTYTEEENKILTSTGTDIEKYATEMRDKFIAGEESFDKWDKYVETIEKMGLDKYMEVQQDAYERYKGK